MKLFTNKQFQRVLEKELAPLKQENLELRNKIANKEYAYLNEKNKLEQKVLECADMLQQRDEMIVVQDKKILKLIEDKKLFFGAKGGLTKQNNKLREELDKVKQELKEAKKELSKRYILKELAPVKAKNTQVMKTKSGSMTSRIIKKVVEDNE